eukprot:1159103-Pelagomonas_calceolata.AAC.7
MMIYAWLLHAVLQLQEPHFQGCCAMYWFPGSGEEAAHQHAIASAGEGTCSPLVAGQKRVAGQNLPCSIAAGEGTCSPLVAGQKLVAGQNLPRSIAADEGTCSPLVAGQKRVLRVQGAFNTGTAIPAVQERLSMCSAGLTDAWGAPGQMLGRTAGLTGPWAAGPGSACTFKGTADWLAGGGAH